MAPRIEIALLAVGCAEPVIDAGDGAGAYFKVTGPVDLAVPVTGIDTRAALAWVWTDAGELCARADEIPFEPQVHQYAVWIGGPPQPRPADDTCVVAPASLPPVAAFGALLLIEPVKGSEPAISVDPSGLLDWFAKGTGLADAVQADGGTVAGVAEGHALGAGVGGPEPSGDWCRFAGLTEGLTLYRDAGLACGGWEPIAPAGTRTEFQGVGVVPVR